MAPCLLSRFRLMPGEEIRMYGTIARMRIKPGMERQFLDHLQEYEQANIPGALTAHVFRMDGNPNEIWEAVLFESKEAYWDNARSSEQDARYRRMLQFLEGEPEWHDGEVVGGTQFGQETSHLSTEGSLGTTDFGGFGTESRNA
jgi:hypothetical protein